MALTTTTASVAIAASDIQIKVASATGFTKGYYIKADNEMMQINGDADGLFVPVRRGVGGTAAKAHAAGIPVSAGLGSDFADAANQVAEPMLLSNQWSLPFFSYDTAGALNPVPGIHEIVGTAKAMTLVDPSPQYNGKLMVIYGSTAAAHTVSLAAASSSFNGAGSDNDVATFSANGLQVMLLVAVNGKWCLPSLLAGANIADVTVTLA